MIEALLAASLGIVVVAAISSVMTVPKHWCAVVSNGKKVRVLRPGRHLVLIGSETNITFFDLQEQSTTVAFDERKVFDVRWLVIDPVLTFEAREQPGAIVWRVAERGLSGLDPASTVADDVVARLAHELGRVGI